MLFSRITTALTLVLYHTSQVSGGVSRKLNDYEIDTPIVCYYDGLDESDNICIRDIANPLTTGIALPDGHVPAGPAMVVIFPHDDVTTYGSTAVTYYDEECTTVLIDLQQALFPAGVGPDVNEDGSTNAGNVFVNGDTSPKPVPAALEAITTFAYPLDFLDDLPNNLVTVTDNSGELTYEIAFCIRFQLFQTASNNELGFREVDLTVQYTQNDATSLTFIANDIDPILPTIDIGDFTIAATVCTGTSPEGTASDPVEQGDEISICLAPQKDDGTASGPTTDIIISGIEDFTVFIDANSEDGVVDTGEVQQAVVVNGVVQPETSTDGAICGLGKGDPADAAIYGCAFDVTLNSPFFETGTVAAGGDVTVTGLGTVLILFNGRRRKLQFSVGDSASLGTSGLSFALSVDDNDDNDDDTCAEWFFLFQWICIIWEMIF